MIVGSTKQVNRIFESGKVVKGFDSLHRQITEGRMEIGPKLAAAILNGANYERQRKIYPHAVDLLASLMREGNWMAGSQIAFARLDGRLHLVNGQHRMQALIESGRTEVFQVLIETVTTETEVDQLYYRFDVVQRKRSTAEVLSAMEVSDYYGLSKNMTSSVYRAVGLIMCGMHKPHYAHDPVATGSIDARLEAAEPWWPIAVKYEAAIKGAPASVKRKLRNAGMCAVALITLRYQPDSAFEFWNGLAENDGLRKGDPRGTLLTDMANRSTRFGTSEQSQMTAALAWNAFFQGRTLQIIKIAQNATLRIAGTPYDGRKA